MSQRLKSVSGINYDCEDAPFSVGGQGAVYMAMDLDRKSRVVFKQIVSLADPENAIARLQFLRTQLRPETAGFPWAYLPHDTVLSDGMLGHITYLAEGVELDKLISYNSIHENDAIMMAIMLCAILHWLHKQNILFGDLHPGNIMVGRYNNFIQIMLIDWDNLVYGTIHPDAYGRPDMLSPSVLSQYLAKNPAVISKESECYGLAVILHMIFTYIHPAQGFFNNESERDAIVLGRSWPNHPMHSPCHGLGRSTEILHPRMVALFNRAFAGNDPDIPTAAEWLDALRYCLNRYHLCDNCKQPFFADGFREGCPLCGARFPGLYFFNGASWFELKRGITILGRDELGGRAVSGKHLRIEPNGDELAVRFIGRNTTRIATQNGVYDMLPDKDYRMLPGDMVLLPGNMTLRFMTHNQ